MIKADAHHLLDQHSRGSRATYGYIFRPYIDTSSFFNISKTYKTSADHGDELAYVFGFPYLNEDILAPYEGTKMSLSRYLGQLLHDPDNGSAIT